MFNYDVPKYSKSRQFVLGQDQDLEQVLRVLKPFAEMLKEADE
ncbi:MAG: hypothetical protein AAFV90_15100 [Cyanobacteria bacterium J06634_5]